MIVYEKSPPDTSVYAGDADPVTTVATDTRLAVTPWSAVLAFRQPGSAFKPFVYALALENGYTPSTLILDAPMVLEQGFDLKLWKPENYGKKFYGPSTLRTGLEKSRKCARIAWRSNLSRCYHTRALNNNTRNIY